MKIPHKLLTSFAVPAWVIIAFLGVQLLVGLYVQTMRQVGISVGEGPLFSLIVSAIAYSLTILVLLGIPHLARRSTTRKELGLTRGLYWRDYLWLLGGFVAYLVVTNLVMAASRVLLPNIDYDQTQQTGYESLSQMYEYILAFLGLVVIAPISEEIMFRGFLFGKLRTAKVPTWLAIGITSLVFAVLHFQGNVGIDVFALSIVLCLLRLWSGSLWAPIMLHMLKNGIAFYFLFINPSILSTLGG